LRELLLVENFEVDGCEVHGRKSRPADGVRQRLPQIRKKDGGTVDREHGLKLFGRQPADGEHAGLRRFDQEQRLVTHFGRQRDSQYTFIHVGLDLLATRAQANLDLRLFLSRKRLRRTRVLERKILDVDPVD